MIQLQLRRGVVPLVFLLLSVAVCTAAKKNPKERIFTVNPSTPARPLWPWANEEWSRSDVDFVRIRREVDSFIQSTSANPNRKAVVLAKLRQLAQGVQRTPHNAQAQFRWAYATHEARKIDARPILNGSDIFDRYEAFEAARPGNSYQYDRMVYILRSRISDAPYTKVLGKRLLRRDPADADVKHFLTRVLSTGTLEEQSLALRFAQELQRETPQLPRTQALLGWVYTSRWNREHKIADVDKALASYRKYLSMIPPTHSSRRSIELLVGVLQGEKAQRPR